jgi:carbamoyltransferase
MTALLGMSPGQDEYRVESLARLGPDSAGAVSDLLEYRDGGIVVDPGFESFVTRSIGSVAAMGEVASAVQYRVGELLRHLLEDVSRATGARTLCVGGGLFYNTFLNTVASGSGLFDRVVVPVNPGNAGVCAGAALLRGLACGAAGRPGAASPFLGPEYSSEQIKAVLDNCKLQYEFLDDFSLVQRAVEALERGELVGWFRGRLEWGTRALGNRSILASPFAPYVLENLNRFLKHRPPHRSYGLAVCAEDAPALFDGPVASPFMECEYGLRDRERFAGIAPPAIRRVRVQTVYDDPPALRQLLKTFGQATGTPVLINTSFNGLHEPVVCSPRDAVRVFYGTGLDLLCVGNFLLRK